MNSSVNPHVPLFVLFVVRYLLRNYRHNVSRATFAAAFATTFPTSALPDYPLVKRLCRHPPHLEGFSKIRAKPQVKEEGEVEGEEEG